MLKGKFSLFKNLPHVEVGVIDGHACISLVGLVRHLCAHGIPLAFTEEPDGRGGISRNNCGVHGCKAMNELLMKMKNRNVDLIPTSYTFMLPWSDGFIRSYVCQRDNNVWILTITFPNPNGNATSKFHTHCVAVGKASSNHTAVIDYFLSEFETLMSGINVYCGMTCKFKRIQMGVLAYIADRPERSALLHTLHLGTYGKRSLWCANIDQVKLPYCQSCFDQEVNCLLERQNGPLDLSKCGRCCQWDMESSSPALRKKPSPENYPTTCDVASPVPPVERAVGLRFLKPVRLNFSWMVSALQFASHNVQTKRWNKKTLQAYLNCCAIPDKIVNMVWTKCRSDATALEVRSNYQEDDNEIDGESNIDESKKSDQHPIVLNSQDTIPKVWLACIVMSAWIDAGMHHIFHGVVADVIHYVGAFMKHHTKETPFHRSINPHLKEVQSLRLSWCRVKTFPKTQWLAEDELGFTRIIPFIYGQFFVNESIPSKCNTTQESWLYLQRVVSMLHVMVCMLMSPRDPNVSIIDRHVKIFLSCCHQYSTSYYDSNTIPFWASTGNFPSLLNLGEQIGQYGPLRWYWEGTRERFIQSVKKVLISMRKTDSYFARKMIIMQKLNVMEWLKEALKKNNDQELQRDYERMYYRYESFSVVKSKFERGVIMSGFVLPNRDDWIFIAFGERGAKMRFIGISLAQFDQAERNC